MSCILASWRVRLCALRAASKNDSTRLPKPAESFFHRRLGLDRRGRRAITAGRLHGLAARDAPHSTRGSPGQAIRGVTVITICLRFRFAPLAAMLREKR